MQRRISKKILILSAVLIQFLGLFGLNSTYAAFFNDEEKSIENELLTGTLDLLLHSNQVSFDSDELDLGEGGNRDIRVKNVGSMEFPYRLTYQFVSGNEDLCNVLQLKIKYNGTDLKYSGLLKDLSYLSDLNLPSGSEHYYDYELIMPSSLSDELSSQACTFDIQASAWQDNLPEGVQGFWDGESLENTIISADWVAPEAIVGPLDTYYNSNPISIPFTATDEKSNVVEVKLYFRYEGATNWEWAATLDDTNFTPALVINGYFDYDPYLGKNGYYEFAAVATDSAGNEEATPPLAMETSTIYDNRAPVTEISYENEVAELGGKLYVDDDTKFSLSASDVNGGVTVSGVNVTYYSLDGGVEQIYTGVFVLAGLNLTQGDHYLEYYSVDNAGNIEVKKRLDFTYGLYQSVVINEVMWMGSMVSSQDEWIELRNMTDQDIDIGQWTIENARAAGQPDLMIPANATISAGGYFLIGNYPETSANTALNVHVDEVNNSISLANSGNNNLILKNIEGNIIDQAKGDSWAAGINDTSHGVRRSMERNDIPGSGLDASDWHTCMDEVCNDTVYWDEEGDNYGTLGGQNHSDNDPTLEIVNKEVSLPLKDEIVLVGEEEKKDNEE